MRPGDILAGKYRVDQVLGAGGMGVVVAAEHLELHERVAIKFLLEEASEDGELSERFLREARAAVKIKSEHVVRVIDVGRLSSGSPYMVMEYLEGEDLSELLQRGRVPIADAVDYVIQCCEAMNVAHRAGIVHRDLKPANLFLTHRPDGSAIVKVLDFGISKVKAEGALNLTRTQAMMGSPLYMSPEQMRSSKDVDRRTDVWSLGVILHELIAGDVPFSGNVFPEVLLKVMTEPAPRLGALRAEVPAGLEEVVLRCLEKDPDARFPSVAALAVALTPFASERTFSLQARLEHSVSDPPRVSPEPVRMPAILSATRKEGQEPPSQLGLPAAARAESSVHAIGTLPSAGSAELPQPEARLPAGTHTSWEDPSPSRDDGSRSRWPLRAATVAGLLAFAAGMAVIFRPGPPRSSHAAPQAAAAAIAPAAAPAANPAAAPVQPAAPTIAKATTEVAPITAAQTPAPKAASAPAPVATPKPEPAPPARVTQAATRPRARATAPRPRPLAKPSPAPTAAPSHAPATAAEPIEPKTPSRAKPLSLEFK